AENVAAQVAHAAQQITNNLTEKGEHITLAPGRAGDTMMDALGERGGDLLQRLERTSLETTASIEEVTNKLDALLENASARTTSSIAEIAERLQATIEASSAQSATAIAEAASRLNESMENASAQLT